jgi:hypothetical protein
LSPQLGQQTLIDRGPALPPVTDGLGVIESPWSLLQQGQASSFTYS